MYEGVKERQRSRRRSVVLATPGAVVRLPSRLLLVEAEWEWEWCLLLLSA